ncbi:hypothetical protein T4D_10988 [Trichinella pseudospiralis]|uniref:Uncharacterized protein n=1 Tax=Trichinella pseudospiralis TaxID=6337 RepID=A0A0V1F708_TRIPS|nr:hypothetical protein T4D_10988 [Trichinella pseudospiralis]
MHAGRIVFRRGIICLSAILIIGNSRSEQAGKMPKLTSIAEEDIVDTLFTYGMLAKEYEEYWITFQQAYMKYFKSITDVIVNALWNSSLKR